MSLPRHFRHLVLPLLLSLTLPALACALEIHRVNVPQRTHSSATALEMHGPNSSQFNNMIGGLECLGAFFARHAEFHQ